MHALILELIITMLSKFSKLIYPKKQDKAHKFDIQGVGVSTNQLKELIEQTNSTWEI